MKIEGSYTLKAPKEKVWRLLLDPAVLSRTIPGCEKLEAAGPDAYRALLNVGVGAVKGQYTGQVRLEEQRPHDHFKLVVEGKGAPGFVKGAGTIDLEEREGETVVNYVGDAQVGGTIAGVGQRMLQATAKMLVAQFFTALSAELNAAGSGGAPPKQGFFRNLMRMILAFFRNIV